MKKNKLFKILISAAFLGATALTSNAMQPLKQQDQQIKTREDMLEDSANEYLTQNIYPIQSNFHDFYKYLTIGDRNGEGNLCDDASDIKYLFKDDVWDSIKNLEQQQLDGTTFSSLISEIMDVMGELKERVYYNISPKGRVGQVADRLIYNQYFKDKFIIYFNKWLALSDKNAPSTEKNKDELKKKRFEFIEDCLRYIKLEKDYADFTENYHQKVYEHAKKKYFKPQEQDYDKK